MMLRYPTLLLALCWGIGTASVRAQEVSAPVTDGAAAELAMLERAMAADAAVPGAVAAPAPQPWPGAVGERMQMDLALILNAAGAIFSRTPLQLGEHDPARTGFTFQQLELSAGASVDTYFRLDANLLFAEHGAEVEEAYASTLALPAGLKLRLGQFLTRVGRVNATHPHAWHFVDSMLASAKFWGGEANRGLGLELSWLTPLPWYMELIGSQTDAAGDETARSWLGGEEYAITSVGDFLTSLIVKQYWDLGSSWGLSQGLAYQTGPNASGPGQRSELYAADMMLRYRPAASARRAGLTLQAELMHRRRHMPGGLLADWGGYIYEIWHVSPRWELGARQERVTGLAADPLDPHWNGKRDRYSAQLTWYPSHFSRFRLQGNYDLPAWRTDPILGLMLGAEFTIGAHGAHAY